MGIIENKLSKAGYQMLGIDESIENLILTILQTKNIRYLKAIPFLIYKHKADLKEIIEKTKNKELLSAVLKITKKIFLEFDIKINIPELHTNFKEKLAFNEFKEEFELQLNNKPDLLIDKQKIYEERNLEMWLSQLFTKKEKEIIKKILEEQQLTKTEYEYYSRKTKKKLNSIIGLEDFAKMLYPKGIKRGF